MVPWVVTIDKFYCACLNVCVSTYLSTHPTLQLQLSLAINTYCKVCGMGMRMYPHGQVWSSNFRGHEGDKHLCLFAGRRSQHSQWSLWCHFKLSQHALHRLVKATCTTRVHSVLYLKIPPFVGETVDIWGGKAPPCSPSNPLMGILILTSISCVSNFIPKSCQQLIAEREAGN